MESKKSEVWESLWENYDQISSYSILNDPGSMLVRSEFIGLLLKYFNLSGKSILEIGVGTGQYCIELARRGIDITGIDIDPASIKLAKRVAKDYNVKPRLMVDDLMKVTDQYDIVYSMGVMEHFNDDEMIPMLKKMGQIGEYVIVGVPCSDADVYKLSKQHSMNKGTWE